MERVIELEGCTVVLNTPDISDEERAKRRKAFEEATARFLIRVEEEMCLMESDTPACC